MKVSFNTPEAIEIINEANDKLSQLYGTKIKVTPHANFVLDIVGVEQFAADAAAMLGVALNEMRSNNTRKREIVEAKQLVIYFLAKKSSIDYLSIANFFSYADHTMVVYAVKTIRDLLAHNDDVIEKHFKLHGMLKEYEGS